MDMGLFPATFKRVSTAFTFRVLEDQRLDHLECKTPLLKYWTKLRRKTSPDDWDSVPVCPIFSVSVSKLQLSIGSVSGDALRVPAMEAHSEPDVLQVWA